MNKSISALALALTMTSGAFTVAHAQNATSPVQNQTQLSVGEQTQRDLAAWRAAGFDDSTYAALSYDPFSKAYQERYAEYERLRALNNR